MELLADYRDVILLGIAAVCLIFVIMFMIIFVKMSRLKKKMKAMLGGSESVNIEEAIIRVQQQLTEQHERQTELKHMLEQIANQLKRMKAKSAIVRYNAFQETGNDMSFSIAVVDDNGNGHVLTGIHNRQDTLMYAKPVVKGQSSYTLSPEEKEAINQALQG